MVGLLRIIEIQAIGGCGESKDFISGYFDMKVLETIKWLPARGG